MQAFLLLGSNKGDRADYLARARHAIGNRAGNMLSASSVYETAAWGKPDQPPFLNQVVMIETELLPRELLAEALSIEMALGRKPGEKWSQRIIDIDILFYGGLVVQQEDLIIPHLLIAQRRFTLVPLAELAPDFQHPVLKKTIRELLNECDDTLGVEIWVNSPPSS